ncbi:MAG: glycosyltransferase family 39 protein [Chloroflexi bacterium]|nr:glycosyltransferase family 39 protein [Chloroflexota bacterium]
MNELRRTKAHFAVIAFCLALTYVLGLSNLKSFPIVGAEYNSTLHLSATRFGPTYSLPETVDTVVSDKVHSPGYVVLLNLWNRLAGRDLFALRLFSVYFGLFGVAITYRLALLTGSADIAIDAALLAASLAFAVYFTYTVRMYGLLAMLSVSVAWCYWKVTSMARPVPLRYWIAFIAASSAILWVHYLGLIALAAVGLYHLAFARKDRRWLQTCLALIAAVLLFAPWLPVLIAGIAAKSTPDSNALSSVDSVLAMASIYTNGLPFIAPVVGLAAALNYRRLGQAQKYILILACAIVLLLLAANEFTTLLYARRIRYTIIFALPWACALAIGLNLLPAWRLIRIPFLILWIAGFAAYSSTDDLLLYTNWLTQDQHKMPHYQDLLYEPAVVTNESDFIVSFHPDTSLTWQIPDYYNQIPGKWAGLIHIWTAPDGIPAFKSSVPELGSVSSMASWRFPVWLIYNPQETDLGSIPAYAEGFANHYRSCGRFVEKPSSVIERYAPVDVSCALLTSADPLAINYDNGTALANIHFELDADTLYVYSWWSRTDFGKYTYTLQVFDSEGAKAAPQTDNLIGDSGLYSLSLDVSSLSAGEYVVRQIVYDTISFKSQPGQVAGSQTQFQREVEVGRFTIGD